VVLTLLNSKRIFILHPSHHRSLSKAALPTLTAYSTPLSSDPLPLDIETIAKLSKMTATIHESYRAELYRIGYSSNPNQPASFTTMSASVDEAEHSAEMQLPYLHRLLQLQYPDLTPKDYPPIVPIMIGSTTPVVEAAFGRLLAPYIADESNAFVISSDFCHWGSRFSHTFYMRDAPSPAISALTLPNGVTGSGKIPGAEDAHKSETLIQGTNLHLTSKTLRDDAKIYESIALKVTSNTICGRHPIGVFVAGVEEVERLRKAETLGASDDADGKGRFRFVRYERSSDVVSVRDSSVSYVSAFAVL
jgi:AmmeMemoRadiSam system protein B